MHHRQLRLRFDRTDEAHWPFHEIDKKHLRILLKRLKYVEALTVSQAFQNGVIAEYDMSSCPNKQARTVLEQSYDGLDSLTKIVIEPSGPLRAFAIKEGHELHLIWWDPTHSVWPEGKIRR